MSGGNNCPALKKLTLGKPNIPARNSAKQQTFEQNIYSLPKFILKGGIAEIIVLRCVSFALDCKRYKVVKNDNL